MAQMSSCYGRQLQPASSGSFGAGGLTVPYDSSFDRAVHLSFADVTVDDLSRPSMLKIHLKVSKTDPFGRGVDVIMGKTWGSHNCSKNGGAGLNNQDAWKMKSEAFQVHIKTPRHQLASVSKRLAESVHCKKPSVTKSSQ